MNVLLRKNQPSLTNHKSQFIALSKLDIEEIKARIESAIKVKNENFLYNFGFNMKEINKIQDNHIIFESIYYMVFGETNKDFVLTIKFKNDIVDLSEKNTTEKQTILQFFYKNSINKIN